MLTSLYCGIGCVKKCIKDNGKIVDAGHAHESIISLWTEARDYLLANSRPVAKLDVIR